MNGWENCEPTLNTFEVEDVRIVHDPMSFAPYAVARVKMFIHPELEITTHQKVIQCVEQHLKEKLK